MELAAGTRVGPYEIQRKVGAGGMGVVYRALDSRLGRAVAIKVLPVAMSGDVQRLKRFEREARTIGSLNHPNLVTLYDVGTHDSTPYLVTELLDGSSLRGRLSEGKLRPREAVRIAGEIARGLAAAHGAGITHRDIKPENIFVMTDDRVKVLDFGIAKLTRPGETDQDDQDGHGATLEGVGVGDASTATGMVIGTPGYMAPEQLGAGNVDPRTDIFALGVVLHEMLSGRRPFATDSGVGIEESYAILKSVPTDLPTNVSPVIARVVRRCLEKRPDARFQSASDLAFALDATDNASDQDAARSSHDAMAETAAQPALARHVPTPLTARMPVLKATPPPTTATPETTATTATATTATATTARPGRSVGPWLVGAVALVVAGVVAIVWIRARPVAPATAATPAGSWPSLVEGGPVYRRVTFLPQPASYARLVPGDQELVWSIRRDEEWHVIRSGVASPSALDLDLQGRVLDVSSKGELALRVRGEGEGGALVRVRPGLGAPQFVADHVEEAAWGPDASSFAILRATANGDVALEYPIGKVLLRPAPGGLAHVRVSDSGDFVAVCETDAPPRSSGRVAILDRAGTVVARSQTYDHIDGIAWSAGDAEAWFSEGTTLHALDRSGRERVLLRSPLRLGLRDVTADNRMLIAPTEHRARTLIGTPPNGPWQNVAWFDGSEVRGISRDGTTIVFLESTGTFQDANGFAAYRRTGIATPVAIGQAFGLALLPDASATIMVTGATTPLRRVPTDARPATELPMGAIAQFDLADRPAVSWNGRYLVVRAAAATGRMRLWRYDLVAGGAPEPIGPDSVLEGSHPISPDGDVIALADRGKGIQLLAVAGGTTRRIGAGELVPLSFSDTGKLFVMGMHDYPRVITALELAEGGAQTPWMTITPDDKPKTLSIALAADGGVVAWSVVIETSELYIVEPPQKR